MGDHNACEDDKGFVAKVTGVCGPVWKKYRKFIVAALGAGIVALQSAVTDGHVTQQEWWLIATSAATAAGVWRIPNKSGEPKE
jgi:hypothetical protein